MQSESYNNVQSIGSRSEL